MIITKKDFHDYLKTDFDNNYLRKSFKFLDKKRAFLKCLRKAEYYNNNNRKVLGLYYKIKYKKMQNKLLTFIPLNVFGKGLSISHFGCIYVNPNAKVGNNCRIHEMVTIGSTNGLDDCATVGDNVYIGSGAKIIGKITISSDVAIGAGAVVVKSISEGGTTWGGVPATKISNNNSHKNIKCFNASKAK